MGNITGVSGRSSGSFGQERTLMAGDLNYSLWVASCRKLVTIACICNPNGTSDHQAARLDARLLHLAL